MPLNLERLDRTVSSVTTFADAEQEDRAFWHSRTPEERLMYVEWLRQLSLTTAILAAPQTWTFGLRWSRPMHKKPLLNVVYCAAGLPLSAH